MKKLIIQVLVTLAVVCCYTEATAQSGCTNPISCNFDPLATVDDGSCMGPFPDLNCDHITNVLDYMLFMNCMNCTADPSTASIEVLKCDFDQNGFIGVADLVILIAEYSNIHPYEY